MFVWCAPLPAPQIGLTVEAESGDARDPAVRVSQTIIRHEPIAPFLVAMCAALMMLVLPPVSRPVSWPSTHEAPPL